MNIVSLATLGFAATLLLMKLPVVRRSTLLGPVVWLLAAIAALALSCGLTWASSRQLATVVAFLAASLTICPVISVLGAKRPQDRAWHFVVAALWLVLILPIADTLVFDRNEGIELHLVRRIFLATLVTIGMANYVGTRFWPSALLYAAGQVLLFESALGLQLGWLTPGGRDLGSFLIGLATTLACLGIPRRRSSPAGLTREWLDFRDAFGAAWALRVADRWNRASAKLGWGVRLAWSGFVSSDGSSSEPHVTLAAERSFRMLLRRFVSTKQVADSPVRRDDL